MSPTNRMMPAMPSRRRTPRFAWSAAALAMLLTACGDLRLSLDSPLTTFEEAGPFSQQINAIFWPVFWVATVIFVVVQAALLVVVFVFRDRPGRKEPKQVHGNAVLEVTWTAIPALILAGIAVPTVQTVFDLTECGPDAMDVEIIGHQWWFEYHYPEHDITTANVLVMPAGREVCARMTSDDVLHNFWIPALNGKRYLIPGQETLLRLQSDEPGEFWGHCAEFCGLSHSLMRARAETLSEADWEAWVEAQQQPATVPAEGTPERAGLQVFVEKGCAACHNVNYTDADRNALEAAGLAVPPLADDAFNGPDLTHFASRNVFAGAYLPYEGLQYGEALSLWLANPPDIKPGSYMPNLNLTGEEIENVIAWLGSNS